MTKLGWSSPMTKWSKTPGALPGSSHSLGSAEKGSIPKKKQWFWRHRTFILMIRFHPPLELPTLNEKNCHFGRICMNFPNFLQGKEKIGMIQNSKGKYHQCWDPATRLEAPSSHRSLLQDVVLCHSGFEKAWDTCKTTFTRQKQGYPRAKVMIGEKYMVLHHQAAAFVNIKWVHEKYVGMQQVKQPKISVYCSSTFDMPFHNLLTFTHNIFEPVSVIFWSCKWVYKC